MHTSNFRIREIFLHKIHLCHLKALAIQMGQRSRLRGKGKGQLVGIEGLVIPVKPLVQLGYFPSPKRGWPAWANWARI